MKRIIILCTVLALLFSMTCISASAEETEETEETEKSVFPYSDSRNIPDLILERCDNLINGEETVAIIRFYERDVVDQIACYNNMEEAFAKYNKWELFMRVTTGGKVYFYSIDPSGFCRKKRDDAGLSMDHQAFMEYQTQEALKAISPDIVLENMYYIASGLRGSGIYYKTNMGDYVFFNVLGSNSLIFSEEAFFAYIKVWQQELIDKYDGAGDTGHASPKLDSLDLSAYDYKSPNFNPNAPFPEIDIPKQDAVPNATVPTADSTAPAENTVNPILLWVGIGTGVLLVAGGAAFYFIKRKKATVAE